MKKIFFLAIFICSFIFSHAQNEIFTCHVTTVPNSTNTDCSAQSQLADYVPDDTDDVKIVRVNIWVIGKNVNDPRNFVEGNDVHEAHIRSLFDAGWFSMNGYLRGNKPATYNGQKFDDPGEWLGDTKIQIEIEADIKFEYDPLGWDGAGNANDLCDSYLYDKYVKDKPQYECALNVFLFEGFGEYNNAGCGLSFLNIRGEYKRFQVIETMTDPGAINGIKYLSALLLAHEFGHSLGLGHSFSNCNNAYITDIKCPDNTGGSNDDCRGCLPSDPDCTGGCSNNLMGYSRTPQHLAHLQIGRMHQRLLNDRNNILKIDYDATKTIEIDEAETWDLARIVYGDVIVQSGGSLAITCKVIMPPGGKIIVEPGGVLNINGGWITASPQCGNGYWKGIEVWGDSNIPFSPITHGILVTNNDAKIEHASVGIAVHQPGTSETGGAVAMIHNTEFLNNGISIEFKDAERSIFSVIENCTFDIDDNLSDVVFTNHVRLSRVSGINVKNCDFDFSNTEDITIGNGLNTFNAKFKVWDCTFKNLTYGINSANGGGSIANYEIDNNIFENNYFGVFSNDVDFGYVTRNDFILDEFNGNSLGGPYEGVSTLGGTGFKIEENVFETNNAGALRYGILINSSGEEYNEIYRNSFTSMRNANISMGDNRNDIDEFEGLQYKCNDNTGNRSDFKVPKEENVLTEGIAATQGSLLSPAGNTFSHDNSIDFEIQFDINNPNANESDYFFFDNDLDQKPLVFTRITPIATPLVNSCLSNFSDTPPGGGCCLSPVKKAELGQKYDTSRLIYNQKKVDYKNQKDGGNTQNLLNNINTLVVGGANTMYNELMEISPFLSKKALVAISNRVDIYNKNILFQLMLANPDETGKLSMLEHLANKVDPFPQIMIDSLIINGQRITERTELESDLSFHLSEWTNAANTLIRDILIDTTGVNLVDLKGWLTKKGSIRADYTKVDLLLSQKNTVAALQALNNIPQLHQLTTAQQDEWNDLQTFKQLQAGWIANGKAYEELNPSEVHQLEILVDNGNGKAARQARSILEFFYGYDFYEPLYLEDYENNTQSDKGNLEINMPISKTTVYQVTARPNPGQEWIYFDYSLGNIEEKAELVVMDMLGNIVFTSLLHDTKGQTSWNAQSHSKGLYYYAIRIGKGMKMIEKLLIN